MSNLENQTQILNQNLNNEVNNQKDGKQRSKPKKQQLLDESYRKMLSFFEEFFKQIDGVKKSHYRLASVDDVKFQKKDKNLKKGGQQKKNTYPIIDELKDIFRKNETLMKENDEVLDVEKQYTTQKICGLVKKYI